jgi:hypothetical protein
MIAKNVGFRRARGEFALVTKVDIIFSPALIQFLAGRTRHPVGNRLACHRTFGFRPLCRMDPEAEILFQRISEAAPRLLMDLEAGPSAGCDPITLEVADSNGFVLATTTFRGRAIFRLHLPPELTVGRLRLRVRGRGLGPRSWYGVGSGAGMIACGVSSR